MLTANLLAFCDPFPCRFVSRSCWCPAGACGRYPFSFGSITVRLSPHLDAFQYLLWRSLGVVPPILAMALYQRRSPIGQIVKSGWLGLAGGACLTVRR